MPPRARGRRSTRRPKAGYAATGARFKEAEINVRLPDASRFASEIGRLSFSVQLRAGQVNDKSYSNYSPGPGLAFRQARIGVELGATPWSTTPFRAPGAAIRLAKLGVPPAPPSEAEIATYNGHGSCLTSWWAHNRVKLTSNGSSGGAVEASPHHLSNHGCNFGIYLEP